jgi:hypothetical protein
MNLTYEELQTLTTAYKAAREELGKKLVLIPAGIKVYNPATESSSTLLDMLRDMADETMPAEAEEAHENAMKALLIFQNIMNEKHHEAKMNNYNVSMDLRDLHSEYLKATAIPERLLSAVLLVNKKNIAEADHAILVDVYKSLGMTHYSTYTLRDVVYYNPNQLDLDGFKNMIIMNSPSLFQHNYPNFWDNMKGEYVDADPLTACMSMVINARKS